MTPNTIQFYTQSNGYEEVLRLSREGVWANPEIPVDEAAKKVLEAIDGNIKLLVQKAVEDEREACAKVCEALWSKCEPKDCAAAIRARGKK